MHRLFADWYRLVDLDPAPETLERRWRCVTAVADDLDAESALALVQILFQRTESPPHSKLQQFVNIIKGTDNSFPVAENRELLRVMLCATASLAISDGSVETADVVALAIRTARFQGLVPFGEPESVSLEASKYLQSEGLSRRAKPIFSRLEALEAPGDKTIEISSHKVEDAGEWTAANTNMKSLSAAVTSLTLALQQLRTRVARLHAETNSRLSSLDERFRDDGLRVLFEESEILWWLFSRTSEQLQCQFSELPRLSGALIVAKELADKTHILPGPPNSGAFLQRALEHIDEDTSCSLTDVVDDESTRSWRTSLVSKVDHLGPVTPMLVALAKSVDPDVTEWQRAFQRITGVSPDKRLKVSAWARQFYDELLLAKAIQDAAP